MEYFILFVCLYSLAVHSPCSAKFMPLTSPDVHRQRDDKHVLIRSWSSSRYSELHAIVHNSTNDELEARLTNFGEATILPDISRPSAAISEVLSLMVLNQRTGRVMVQRNFRTREEFSWWADLVWWLQRVSAGRLVFITVDGRATLGLRHARSLFVGMGSAFAPFLTQQTAWTWAFVKGGRTIYEALVKGLDRSQINFHFEDTKDNIHAEGIVALSSDSVTAKHSGIEKERWEYCDKHGAMGGLCDEYSPDPLPLPSPPLLAHQHAIAQVPVVVTAGARHQYLYYTLHALLTAPGAQRNNVLVVLGDAPQPTIQLLRLIDVNFTRVPVYGTDNAKLFRYYRSVFQLVARTFPDAPAAIFLDEDVEVSPDFFSFMSQTLWLLQVDPSLYCINTFSFLTSIDHGSGTHYVRRGGTQVMWGYAITMEFINEALRSWPESGGNEDILTYDYWLYDHVSKGRECIFPEVSRIRHYGLGVNTRSLQHEYEAWRRPFLQASKVFLTNTHQMLQPKFERIFLRDLKTSEVLGDADPCQPKFPSRKPAGNYVMFFAMEYKEDVSSWNLLGPCAGLHYTSEQSHHNGVFFAVFNSTSQSAWVVDNTAGYNYFYPKSLESHKAELYSSKVYFVGVPFSKYSFVKPEDAFVFNATAMSEQQRHYYRSKSLQSPDILMINSTYYTKERLLLSLFHKDVL